MPALDFPASPSTGQIFTSGSVTWSYTGTYWTILGSVGSDTPWTNFTFQNGFSNGAGQAAQYRKVGDNVEVRFHLTPGTNGAVAFTLPVGFRPPGYMDIPAIAYNGVHNVANCFVTTSGTIAISWSASSVTGVSSSFQFSVTP
jgi:hypothetical protein